MADLKITDVELPLDGTWQIPAGGPPHALFCVEVRIPFDAKDRLLWEQRINSGDRGRDAFLQGMRVRVREHLHAAADEALE